MKLTDIILQTLKDKDMILLLGSNIRGGISSVIKSDDNKSILYIDAINLYGQSMNQLYHMMKLNLIEMFG